MPLSIPALSTNEPDPALLKRLELAKRPALIVAIAIALFTLSGWLIPSLGRTFPLGWQAMKADSAIAVLFSALSLRLSEPWHNNRIHRLSLILAVAVTLLAVFRLIEWGFHFPFGVDTLPSFSSKLLPLLPGKMSLQPAGAFALLGLSMIFVRAKHRFIVRAADIVIVCLCLLVLVLLSSFGFGALHVFGQSASIGTSPQTLFALALLTAVAMLRRAEHGVFVIFLGRGIGSTIARILLPILLVLPFLRELGRARMLHAHVIPEHYVTSIFTSVATVLAVVLLVVLAWRVHAMEKRIQDLTLRDELTGLYNLRGFSLLAEQALRLARRSQLPLSVLFVDLDRLKEINDSLGHVTGSAFLAETAEILRQIFRETDVMGRIGGDEFAVVCQCSHVEISIAAQRLEAASIAWNSKAGHGLPFSISAGFATMEEHGKQSLKELMTLADQAMYEEKKSKKLVRV
ncbi:MAG: GGDEF domain-containing protein [Terracidiphilus sp.]